MTVKPLQSSDDERMMPVPVKLADYVGNLLIDGAVSEKEKQMRIEVLGMITVMERNLATLHPLAMVQGRIIWELRYPAKSLFLNGPRHHSAWGAIVRNYTKNGKFKKILAVEGGKGDLVLEVNKVTEQSIDSNRKSIEHTQTRGDRE